MSHEDDIARCGVLALLLEVSAYPKPGNVSRRHDFPDTKYEHFIASAVALFPVLRDAAHIGIAGDTSGNIGRLVREGVEESMRWQRGGNTHFGSIMLFIPLAMAAGICASHRNDPRSQPLTIEEMRENATEIMRRSTVEDAVQLYNAFKRANVRVQPVDDLDVRDPDAVREIERRGLTLHDILAISASYDTISAELVGGFQRSFRYADLIIEAAVDHVDERRIASSMEKHIISEIISRAYLHLLASEEDTFVRMKFGTEKSRYVQQRAAEIVRKGYPSDEIEDYDDELIAQRINPGTSADIIAAAMFIALLCGLRI